MILTYAVIVLILYISSMFSVKRKRQEITNVSISTLLIFSLLLYLLLSPSISPSISVSACSSLSFSPLSPSISSSISVSPCSFLCLISRYNILEHSSREYIEIDRERLVWQSVCHRLSVIHRNHSL
jgi:hypothetical protein